MAKTYYLASGFFTPEQIKVVEKYEKLSETHKVDILSPRKRQKSTYDLKLDDPMRDVFLQEIFQQNVEDLNQSDHLLINLSKPYDIGALWELGYFLGYKGGLHTLTSDITVIDGDYNDIRHWIEYNLTNIDPYQNASQDNATRIVYVTDFESFKSAYIAMESNVNCHVSVCIDDRKMDCMIALGYLYLTFGPYRISTYSNQNHGSNVMIACSIANHYKSQPKLGDLTFTLNKWEMNKVTL